MSKPRLLLAIVNWTSLIILIWLLILGLVPMEGVQMSALAFFFLVAAGATFDRDRRGL